MSEHGHGYRLMAFGLGQVVGEQSVELVLTSGTARRKAFLDDVGVGGGLSGRGDLEQRGGDVQQLLVVAGADLNRARFWPRTV